ncbi:MAG: hypothetical protein ACD_49C00009G0041 [uncultured bacterium (gcode 4)]|uniref:Uncharacterized protein n=1 Tax=uncultured bacterium (gcode 4) TaxID=1234023 RepID=K2AYJ1_9BACT|nr:MAG: hypothetical protein ACD_49C00009G0041 [uncultured bacterium (gcode 4)]
MLNIEIKRNKLPILNEKKFVTTKKIAIDVGLEAIIQINFIDKNLVNLIENLAIDILLTNISKDPYNSFSLSLDKLNKEINKLSRDYNLSELNIFVWIITSWTLHFSILWNYSAYLIKNNKIINIADGMQGKNLEFSFISSWIINTGDNIYISNIELLNYISKDDILEISLIDDTSKKLEIIEKIIAEEETEWQYDIVILNNSQEKVIENRADYIEKIKNNFLVLKDRMVENKKISYWIERIKKEIDFENKYIKIGLFSTGVVVSVFFLYLIISGIISQNVSSSVPVEYKNKLIEAKLILERTNKDLGNKDIFYANIKNAENLIFEVRDKQIFLNDVKKLLDHISILKKQANWIESFELTKDKALIELNNFSLGWIFELQKKYYFVWKNGIIGPYIKWEEAKSYNYPDWEEAIASDLSPDWDIFVLTKSYRLLKFYKQEFSYVNVEWQKTWEEVKWVKTFNSNLYLLSATGNQIFRHKPGISGFSSKYWIIDENDIKSLNLYDFAIDGWFYLLKKDLSIDKIITTPTYTKKSIVINGLPANYSAEAGSSPKIFTAWNLNYIYILLNNKIWVFEADSRNYKDVKSLKYIGQLEPQESKINAFYIPKDWEIILWNDKWVYKINFEISDSKIAIR